MRAHETVRHEVEPRVFGMPVNPERFEGFKRVERAVYCYNLGCRYARCARAVRVPARRQLTPRRQ